MGRLRLRAEDEEDLAVISAILQDALVTVGEMTFLPEERRFVLVANRFCWEAPPDDGGHWFRCHVGLCIDEIDAVRIRGFDRREAERILEVLAVRHEAGAIVVDFSGAGAMRLEGTAIACRLEDIDEPWPTSWRPRHPVGGEPA